MTIKLTDSFLAMDFLTVLRFRQIIFSFALKSSDFIGDQSMLPNFLDTVYSISENIYAISFYRFLLFWCLGWLSATQSKFFGLFALFFLARIWGVFLFPLCLKKN